MTFIAASLPGLTAEEKKAKNGRSGSGIEMQIQNNKILSTKFGIISYIL